MTISSDGEPVLKRIPAVQKPDGAAEMETAILQQMPERSLLDILPLFKGVVDWKLIKIHWQDLMRVVLSIKAGKLLGSIPIGRKF